MDTTNYDLIIIGGGPGGYVAALRAAQLGMKVACVEKRKALGGTCLNVGCIPSKALLDSSEHYHYAKSKLQKHGVIVSDVKLDLGQMMKRKDSVVRQLTGGVGMLFKKNKIEYVNGTARLGRITDGEKVVDVRTDAGARQLAAPRVLIASGSEAAALPFLPFDGNRVISSTEALSLPEVPRHLVVIGGGVIGLELGSVWLRLGAKVTVVEFMDRLIPAMDRQLSTELQKLLARQGMEIHLSSKCLGARDSGAGLAVDVEKLSDGSKFSLECDRVLVATGRRPYTDGLGLKEAGIETDKAGRIPVSPRFETRIQGIFAIGDVIEGPMLAHKAEEEGIAAVEHMKGLKGHVNYEAIPGVVYTWPEVASVGPTEEELKTRGVEYKVGTFPFMANGRAKAMDETDGFVKVLADAKTDRVLAVHILGPRASDLIAEGLAAVEAEATSDELARMCHAHPTLPEVTKEAALAVHGRALHM